MVLTQASFMPGKHLTPDPHPALLKTHEALRDPGTRIYYNMMSNSGTNEATTEFFITFLGPIIWVTSSNGASTMMNLQREDKEISHVANMLGQIYLCTC